MTAAQLQSLEVFQNKCLRHVLDWHLSDRHSNETLLATCRISSGKTMLRQHQLRWLGHIGRMGEGRIAKRIMYSTMAGEGRRRRRGAPCRDLGASCWELAQSFRSSLPRGAAPRPPRGQLADSVREPCPVQVVVQGLAHHHMIFADFLTICCFNASHTGRGMLFAVFL